MTAFALVTNGPKGSMSTRVSTRPSWEPFADNGWYFTRVCANVFAPPEGVGFQKLATCAEQQFYAARSYSLIKPPRTGRRLICS
jgi:hypothetical protein